MARALRVPGKRKVSSHVGSSVFFIVFVFCAVASMSLLSPSITLQYGSEKPERSAALSPLAPLTVTRSSPFASVLSSIDCVRSMIPSGTSSSFVPWASANATPPKIERRLTCCVCPTFTTWWCISSLMMSSSDRYGSPTAADGTALHQISIHALRSPPYPKSIV